MFSSVDRFTELSRARFRSLRSEDSGNKVLLFPYFNYDENLPSPLIGLWYSQELVKKRIETAHHIPDNECARALRESGAFCNGVSVWLGLYVTVNTATEQPPIVGIPKYMLNSYQNCKLDTNIALAIELQNRFCVSVDDEA